jgi:hypothetical protein
MIFYVLVINIIDQYTYIKSCTFIFRLIINKLWLIRYI